MLDYTLSAEKLAEQRAVHRNAHEKRETDRIKAVVLLAAGWTAEQVAEVLQVDPNTVRNHFKCYREGGIKALAHVGVGVGVGGSTCALDEKQLADLDAHLQENLYLSAKAIAHRVENTFGVSYTESGMTAVLHRLGNVYKKPTLLARPTWRLARPTRKRKSNSSSSTRISRKTRARKIRFTSWMRSIRNTIQ